MAKRSKVKKSKDTKVFTTRPHEKPRPSTSAAAQCEGVSDCEHHDMGRSHRQHHRNVQRKLCAHNDGYRHHKRLEKKQMKQHIVTGKQIGRAHV